MCLCDFLFINLWQTIDIVVVSLDAEILSEVDNLHVLGDGVLLQELFTLAVSEAEEHHVDLVERHLVRELQIRLADESLMYIAHQVPCVALTVGKHYLCLRMVQQHANELTSRIARCT